MSGQKQFVFLPALEIADADYFLMSLLTGLAFKNGAK
jgi:hypothetical protein